jgi:hypothetical protein
MEMRRAAACRMSAGKILIVMFWIFFPGGRQLRREIPLRPASAAAKISSVPRSATNYQSQSKKKKSARSSRFFMFSLSHSRSRVRGWFGQYVIRIGYQCVILDRSRLVAQAPSAIFLSFSANSSRYAVRTVRCLFGQLSRSKFLLITAPMPEPVSSVMSAHIRRAVQNKARQLHLHLLLKEFGQGLAKDGGIVGHSRGRTRSVGSSGRS